MTADPRIGTAQEAATASPSSPTAWDIDPVHSSAEFEVRHLGISFVTGRFRGLSGSVALDEDHPGAAQVEAAIDAATVDTGVPDRDAHLRAPDFLDVEAHPKLTFVGRRVEVASTGKRAHQAVVHGDLTMRGVTREVAFQVERTGEVKDAYGKTRVGVQAETTVSLKDYGLTWNQPLEAGGMVLGDKVRVRLHLQAVQR